MQASVDQLLAQIGEQKHPPLHLWHPPLSGDIDIEIRRDGSWWYCGRPMERAELVNLFASILRCEDGEHVLVTPVEKWRLRVEDVAFVAVSMQVAGAADSQLIAFTLNTGEQVACDAAHSLIVEQRDGGEPAPYLLLRDGLRARLSRAVFYELVDLAEADGGELIVHSGGARFCLGQLEE
jgi:hypothetical protein